MVPEPAIEVGNVVVPKDGGMAMTVETVSGQMVWSVWFHHGKGPYRSAYPADQLMVVEKR
jgi:uncharacterized protein YodC (DUF2158 family)